MLIAEVEKVKQQRITRTELLYRGDPLNPTSFHKYIDGVEDIVLVVRTEKGFVFASYSEAAVGPGRVADRGGVLLSLSNRLVFPLWAGKRSVTFDSFFLIFGNSEVRLKHGEWKVFCNFGIANGFFNAQGATVNELLGEGKEREVKISAYEVHRVLFEQ